VNIDTVDHGDGTAHAFKRWTGDASGSNNAQSDPIIMNSPKAATSEWPLWFKVTVEANPVSGGTTNPSGVDNWYEAGTVDHPISASAGPGYHFTLWSKGAADSITFSSEASSSTTMTVSGPGTVTANFALSTPSVESSDSSGTVQNKFTPVETVYAYGSGFTASQSVKIYIVIHQDTWAAEDPLSDVRGSATNAVADGGGVLATTSLWANPTPGLYDVIVDANNDGKYQLTEAIDYADVIPGDGTGGFLVVPEYLFGGLAALGACFAAFAFIKRKSLPSPRFHK